MFPAEIDISVSKLLGFETFANFLRFWFRKILSPKKTGFGKFGLKKILGFEKFGLG